MNYDDLETIIRFLTKINHTDNCWEWKAAKTKNGYGVFAVNRKNISAHRFSYELFREEIPKNMEIDHLCRNRKCVNPDHLEVVTPKINRLRGISLPAINARKTHCLRGHRLRYVNLVKTRLRHGSRVCRRCYNNNQRKGNKIKL